MDGMGDDFLGIPPHDFDDPLGDPTGLGADPTLDHINPTDFNAPSGLAPPQSFAPIPDPITAPAAFPPPAPIDDERTDSEGAAPAPVSVPKPAPAPPPAAKKVTGKRPGGRGGTITLRDLINEGLIQPGEDVLSVEYKGNTHIATLLDDGRIHCNISGKDFQFDSPSAFSIFLKRLVNPSRKADDGWKTVKYRGRLLEQYKTELSRKRLGLADGEEFPNLPPLEPRAKRARTDGGRPEPRFKFGNGAPLLTAPISDRPRRQRKAPPRFAAIGVDDEHALQPLEAYGPGEQPFQLRIHPAAELVMDFHAHMSMNEVIGILAGQWNPQTRCIDVLRAYPVNELALDEDSGSINVEMDPEDQVNKMEEAQKAGLKVVGWYHSHPTFQAIPSTIDIYNQVLQQHAHREGDDNTGTNLNYMEPYVAAIVSPYDKNNASHVSTINWFYVAHAPGAVPSEGQRPDEVGCIGKALAAQAVWEPMGQLANLPGVQREFEQLAKRYAQVPDRANLEAAWVDGSLRANKLVNSLEARLKASPVDENQVAQFKEKVLFSTRAVWSVYGKPVVMGSGLAAAAATGTGGDGAAAGAVDVPAPLQNFDVDEPISEGN